MRIRLVLAVLALMTLSLPALAEIKALGQPCSTLGSTTMAEDHQNLIACLQIDSNPAHLYWKSMSLSVSALPDCKAPNQALQSDGTNVTCTTISVGGGSSPPSGGGAPPAPPPAETCPCGACWSQEFESVPGI